MATDIQVGGPDDGQEKYGKDKDEQGNDDLLDLLHEHDEAKKGFYEILKSISTKPSELEAAAAAISNRGERALESWRKILTQLNSDYGWKDPEFVNAVATLWLGDEKERAELLTTLVPEGKFSVMGNGDLARVKEMIKEFYKTNDGDDTGSEEFIDNLVTAYQYLTNCDLGMFEKTLEAQAYLNRNEETTKRRHKAENVLRLGEHVLDVVKMAAGVSLGIVAGSFFRRKHD